VYSTTAIECLQKLTRSNIVKDKIKELLEYTRVENAVNVRLVAFNCLVETGVTRKMSMLAYLLSSLVEDRSPTFRRALLDTLGVALGHIALGDDEPEPLHAPVVNDSGLVLETEVIDHEIRHLEATRKTSPEGALAALKNILQVQPKFKQALWEAVTSPTLALDEIGALADIAALVFDAKVSLGVTLKYPRHWRVVNDGRGKVRFLPHGAYRTAPTKGLPFDDWTILQELKLQYNGPLDEEIVKKREAERRVAELQQELEQAQRMQAIEATRAAAAAQQQQAAMPPPSSLPTPIAEKPPGLKINLGSAGIKRKQSASSTPREGSPKSQKIVKLSTPNGFSGSPIPRESPTAAAPTPKVRRGSTPASAAPAVVKKTGRKIVKLRFKKASSAAKIASLLSKPPRPRPRPAPSTDQHARSSTPSHVKSSHGHSNGAGNTNGSSSASALISPSSFSASPSQAQAQVQSLNTGGFRTYGAPAAEPAEAKPSSYKREAGAGYGEGKYSSHHSSGSHNGSGSHSSSMNKISKSAASSRAPSPSTTSTSGGGSGSGGGGGGDGMAPPKKKFTLKLGAKKMG
jgi:transcription initiation factor TFIID subunit 2